LKTRRSGFAMLKQMEKACIRQRKTFSVCFIDVDGLKRINDQYGHSEGDVVLKAISELIQSSIRDGDAICRIGGDEFMVLFPGCDKTVAEKLIHGIKKALIDKGNVMDKPYLMSFSYGIEQMHAENPLTLEDLIRRADHLMYHEKHRAAEITS